MLYIISRNNSKNTFRTSSGGFHRKLSVYKNKISLNRKLRVSYAGIYCIPEMSSFLGKLLNRPVLFYQAIYIANFIALHG